MKFWYNPIVLSILFLVVLSVPALKSLTTDGFYTSHDGITHTARIAQYYQALVDHQFPPRFAGSFYNNYTSPIFVYIYPLPYLLGSIIHFLGFSFVNSFKILISFSFISSQIFVFLWLNELYKNPKSAFAGALFYGWAPYRFSLTYVRGSISEILAYTFLPIVLFLVTKLQKQMSYKLLSLLSISVALILLSQNLVALISLPIIVAYSALLSTINKNVKLFIFTIVAVAWGFLISSITYLPSILERQYVLFDEIITLAYPSHFISLRQLLYSPWGYGFDLSGTVNDELSFQIGLAHILVFLISVALLTYLTFKNSKERKSIYLPIFFIVIFLGTIFLMLEADPTKFVWRNVRILHFVDIPWRFLGITVLSASALAAWITKEIKSGIFFIVLIFAVLIANRNHLRINQQVIYDDNFFLTYKSHATQYGEFTPNFGQPSSLPQLKSRVESISGDVEIFPKEDKSNNLQLDTKVRSEESQIQINKFYFPGVEVKVDDKKLTPFQDLIIPKPEPNVVDRKNYGLMVINLPEGEHQISIKYKEGNIRLLADFLTLLSLSAAILLLFKNDKA